MGRSRSSRKLSLSSFVLQIRSLEKGAIPRRPELFLTFFFIKFLDKFSKRNDQKATTSLLFFYL